MKRIAIIAAPLALFACAPADNDPGPGGVTVGEAKALDDAAEMLEQRRLPPAALESDAAPDEDSDTQPAPSAAPPPTR